MLARACLSVGLLLVVACSAGAPAGTTPPEARGDVPTTPEATSPPPRDETPSPPSTPAGPSPAPTSTAPPTAACRKSVCLTGAVNHESGANVGFRAICESGGARGRVDDCRSGTCKSTWGTFPNTSAAPVLEAVLDALDTNHDGLLDLADAPCELDVLGFSWGGVNAVDFTRRLNEDPRVVVARRAVHRLVLLDAYQPVEKLVVPPNVVRAASFRHSIAPASDCSNTGPLGPYLGLVPRCAATSACRDFDYSLSPEATFGGLRGKNIGHCDVPTVASGPVAQFLADQPLAGTPKELLVQAP